SHKVQVRFYPPHYISTFFVEFYFFKPLLLLLARN
ncbi:MAG: hypothetical protein ACI840_002752, partial [Ulvibacter sp.]